MSVSNVVLYEHDLFGEEICACVWWACNVGLLIADR